MSGGPRAKVGRVILVGAGPGAPDLLTLRGAAALRRADAVVYDALAAPELLDLAPPGAQRIDVGKRGHDPPTRGHEETVALLVSLAREGKTVVRLKGGDPFVFGRGGEEGTACARAGIPVEVVPGVSSVTGALAYAGIPVTDRRHAASFAVVTGHKDPTKVAAETRWELLARAADTLVILMGMRNLESLVERFLAGGAAPDTPAAVVMNGTLPSQRVVEAPLRDLARAVRAAGLTAPAVVAIGGVVGLREGLAWFERLPLFGKRVLVTRSREQAAELAAALAAAGATAVPLPLLRIDPPASTRAVDAALARLPEYDALLFTSANAVRSFARRAEERGVALAGLAAPVVCVGPKTAEAALAAGLAVSRTPEARFDAEGVLEVVVRHLPVVGRTFLLPRAEEARDVLPDGLRAAGARVDAVAVYRNAPAPVDAEAFRRRLVAGELDALTFASPSAVRRFAALLDGPARAAAGRCVCAAIGPVTARALRREGFEPGVVAPRPEASAFVDALAAHFEGREPPDPGGAT